MIYLYFQLCWVFVATCGLSLGVASRGYSLACGAQTSCCCDFSCCGAWALEHRLSSSGSQAWLLHSVWDLPGAGREPVSPASAGRFLTTGSPGKSLSWTF